MIRVHRCPFVVNQPDNAHREWFYRRSVVSVFTGCRSWKFVRAHASNRARWIDLTKSGGCRTNEARRLRRNRKFFRQIPKERQKLFGFAERRLPTPPPGASADACCQHFTNQYLCRSLGVGGSEKIWTLFENFALPFPEKGVREINGSRDMNGSIKPQENFSCVALRMPSSNQNPSKHGK
jgi:hypothetical protein